MEKDKDTAVSSWGFSGYLEVLPRKQQISRDANPNEEPHNSIKKNRVTRNRRRWAKPIINPASS